MWHDTPERHHAGRLVHRGQIRMHDGVPQRADGGDLQPGVLAALLGFGGGESACSLTNSHVAATGRGMQLRDQFTLQHAHRSHSDHCRARCCTGRCVTHSVMKRGRS